MQLSANPGIAAGRVDLFSGPQEECSVANSGGWNGVIPKPSNDIRECWKFKPGREEQVADAPAVHVGAGCGKR